MGSWDIVNKDSTDYQIGYLNGYARGYEEGHAKGYSKAQEHKDKIQIENRKRWKNEST